MIIKTKIGKLKPFFFAGPHFAVVYVEKHQCVL